MAFDVCFKEANIQGKDILKRASSRVVTKKGDKFLMITSNRGSLIFPGGSVELGESPEMAAIRELKEETGYQPKSSLEYIGKILIRRQDRFDSTRIYEVVLHYFSCEINDYSTELKRSNSELELDAKPTWLSKKEILKGNSRYIKQLGSNDVWIQAVTYVLDSVE